MKIELITHPTLRTLAWATDDATVNQLVSTLRRCGVEVSLYEIEDESSLRARLRQAARGTLFWGNTYWLPRAVGEAPRWLADIMDDEDAPYIGSGAAVLQRLIDKSACQEKMQAAGLPIPRFVRVEPSQLDEVERLIMARGLAWPLFAKPCDEAASHGIYEDSVLRNLSDVRRLCRRLFERFEGAVMVEEFLPGQEMTLGVLGNGTSGLVLASKLAIRSDKAGINFLTEEKRRRDFDRGVTTMLDIEDPVLRSHLEDLARRVCRALAVRDIVRMDCRMDTTGTIRIFDVNGMPGVSPNRGCSVQQVYAAFPALDRGELHERFLCSIVQSAADRYGMTTPRAVRQRQLRNLPTVAATSPVEELVTA